MCSGLPDIWIGIYSHHHIQAVLVPGRRWRGDQGCIDDGPLARHQAFFGRDRQCADGAGRLGRRREVAAEGKAIVLSAARKEDTNTITEPTKVVPVTSKARGLGKQFSYSFVPYSVTVLVLSTK
jgi:hypothetical protein